MRRYQKAAIFAVIAVVMAGAIHIAKPQAGGLAPVGPSLEFLVVSGNSLLPLSPLPEPKIARKVKVVVTAYSSTPWETDDDPLITAAGTRVRDGIIANNLLPFGTKVRLPEIYGDKIFTVEDRLNSKKGPYHFDIWFPAYQSALNFGAKNTYIEIMQN